MNTFTRIILSPTHYIYTWNVHFVIFNIFLLDFLFLICQLYIIGIITLFIRWLERLP